MRVVLLSGASSIHTVRWANALASKGLEIHLISQHPPLEALNSNVKSHIFPFKGEWGYFLYARRIKRLVEDIRPDLVNVHYASGYATTARLIGFHPTLLSVWGSDVYDFPNKSFIHKHLVKKNINFSDLIASTSHCMAKQTNSLLKKKRDIKITPFGVDLKRYNCINPLKNKDFDEKIIIGTVKVLAPKYGIDTLIKSFSILQERLKVTHPILAENLILRIVGDGPQRNDLENLVKKLNLAKYVEFLGRVNHTEVPNILSSFDIFVALSRLDSESFGVAIIEAGAAKRPVVVSDVAGLKEVVVPQKTGLVVPKDNPQAASEAIEKLILNYSLRYNLGINGYHHVSQLYNWDCNVENMINIYKKLCKKF